MAAKKNNSTSEGRHNPSGVFKAGAVSLAFLIIGYQAALFVHRAAVEKIASNRDHPDTVYVIDRALAAEILEGPGVAGRNGPLPEYPACAADISGQSAGEGAGGSTRGPVIVHKPSSHSSQAQAIYHDSGRRKVESFRFNPNTVSVEDLIRLGFSEKQAMSIDNYRAKGGRFRRKGDFAKSFVVADSVFRRLEPFIDIPRIDINKADSAAFDSLPGVGGWTAAKMVEYRRMLHGYSCPEQLMEIYRFDKERFDGLCDLISCSPVPPFRLWSLPADSLRTHPHIRSWQTARAIVFYREHNPRDKWTVDGLLSAGILTEDQTQKLRRCRLE